MIRKPQRQQQPVNPREWKISRHRDDPSSIAIDKVMEQMPVCETSPAFTDQVMQRLTMVKRPVPSPSTPSGHVVQHFTRRKQFIHFAVAGAATYLFVATGILQSLVSVNAIQLEIEMKMRVHHVVTTGVAWLSQIIQG